MFSYVDLRLQNTQHSKSVPLARAVLASPMHRLSRAGIP
jgi:hypothetical protein